MPAEPGRRDHPVVVCAHGADSSGAVQLGALLAQAVHQRLVLTSAYRYDPIALGASPLPPPANTSRFARAVSRIEHAERLVPRGVTVEERPVPAEHVPEALVDLAREVDACALVLGRDLDGHVTRSVIGAAPCPVAVSPYSVPLPEPQPLQTIGVAYDGSPSARRAVTAAAAIAAAVGALVQLVDVGGESEDAEARAGDAMSALPVAVDVLRLDGRPGEQLVARSEELDLLVCGSRGRGRLAAAVLGSVSSHLVRAAHCPVLVVPPGTRAVRSGPLGLTTAAAFR